jgi:hypothetical protein
METVSNDRKFPLSAFTPNEESDSVTSSSILFLDTETTGLGGAGTVPFLVGIGLLDQDGFRVEQYIIPDFSDEAAMLESIMAYLNPDATLVTYNGGAFDLPVLTTRMIVNRVARKLTYGRHIDLLHPTRRLFKRRLQDCSLTNVERELFQFYRKDDIPGYLVPSVYFDWLTEERTDSLKEVLEHNRWDIVTLGFLAVHLAEAFETNGESLDHIDDIHSLSRLHHRRKNITRVLSLNERINDLASETPSDDVLFFHAQSHKKAGDYRQAVPLWQQLSETSGRESYLACIELAMYYEHRDGNIPRAYEYANRAADYSNQTKRQKVLVNKRLKRLVTKLST